jgi:hypothetical protein
MQTSYLMHNSDLDCPHLRSHFEEFVDSGCETGQINEEDSEEIN